MAKNLGIFFSIFLCKLFPKKKKYTIELFLGELSHDTASLLCHDRGRLCHAGEQPLVGVVAVLDQDVKTESFFPS